jgi:molecular chaperone DnaJ
LPLVPVPDLPSGDRFALLIGTAEYADERFARLSGPVADVEGLEAVLGDPGLGGFEVATYVDPTMPEMRTALESFLRERRSTPPPCWPRSRLR